MKKITLSLNLILLLTSIVFAQTNVSGVISSDTTWGIENSPYNITGNVGVANGSELTVESGVVVNFNGNYEILIYGSIAVSGTSENRITFNGNSIGGSGTKKMLEFGQTNLSNSSIDNVDFIGAQDAILISRNEVDSESASSEKAYGTLVMDNCTFVSTILQTDGYDSSGKLLIQNSSFDNTLVKGRYPSSEAIELNNCIVENSILYSDAYHNGFKLFNSKVTNSILTIDCCGDDFQIDSSKLTNCEFKADNDNHKLDISNSILYNTSLIRNDRDWFDDQNLKLSNTTYITDDDNKYLKYQNVEVSNCTFIGKNNNSAIEATDELSVKNTNFVNWDDALLIGGVGSVDSSNFINIDNSYIELTGNEDVPVSKSFFELDEIKSFSEMIIDQNDNLRLGKVNLSNSLSVIDFNNTPTLLPTGLLLSKQDNFSYKLTWSLIEGYSYKLYLNKIDDFDYESVIDLGNEIKEFIINNSDINEFALTAYKDGNSTQLNGNESWYVTSYELDYTLGAKLPISEEINVYISNQQIIVDSQNININKISVIDNFGRLITEKNGDKFKLNNINGVLLVRIETSKGIVVKKLIH